MLTQQINVTNITNGNKDHDLNFVSTELQNTQPKYSDIVCEATRRIIQPKTEQNIKSTFENLRMEISLNKENIDVKRIISLKKPAV